MSESRDQEGLGKGLSKLPKVDKSSLLASFVKQQRRNTNVYEVEGRKYLQTWSRERAAASSTVRSRLGNTSDADRRRGAKEKENEKGKGRTGIETPVLKPRNPVPRIPDAAVEKVHSRTHGKGDAVPTERAKTTEVLKAKVVDKGKEREKQCASKVTAPKANERVKSMKIAAKDKQSDSDSDADTETRDKEQRMNARKERRREKREIVNPKKRKGSPERDSEVDSDEDTKASGTKSKKTGGGNKKQKIPAGLALMHGFYATNIGKSRLTMEPSSRPTGVFSKGKASSKTATTKKAVATGFSELRFLNKRPARGKENSPEPEVPMRRSKEKPSIRKPVKKASSEKPPREPTPECDPTEESSSNSSESEEEEEEEEEEVNARPERRSRSSSITWDIEHESAKLASTDLSVEVPLAQPRKAAKSKASREEEVLVDVSGSQAGEKIWSSLGPQDSASQCVPRDSSPPKRRPETDTFSKYFQQILEQDTGAPNSGKELARTIPCPTFVAAVPVAPEAPPLDSRELNNVSGHRDGSQLSLWLHPIPLSEEKAVKNWRHRDAHEEAMEYESWQEGPRAFHQGSTGYFGSQNRYGFDSTQQMVPSSFSGVPLLDGYAALENDDQQDYWDDTEQLWEELPAGQGRYFDMKEGVDFASALAYGDFDDVGLVLDNGEPCMVYESYPFEELYTEEAVPNFPEGHGGTDSGSRQWNQMELGGSQHEETWQDTGPDHNQSDDEHEGQVGTPEPGASDTGSMQGLLSTNDRVCHFLQGRSALLGFDVDMGAPMPQLSYEPGERQGASKIEIDVAKGLKNHWRPQRL